MADFDERFSGTRDDSDADVQAALASYNDPSKSMAERVGLGSSYAPEDQPQQSTQNRRLSPQSTDFAQLPPVTPPRLQDIPQPSQYGLGPNQQQQSPFSVFFNPMVLLGAASSLLTRKPLMAAMGYATGAMNGFREGQNDVFNQNKVKFNEALDQSIAQNNVEIQKYKAALANREEIEWESARKDLWTEAVRNNDQGMMAAIKMGPERAFKMLEMKEQARDRLLQAQALAQLRSSLNPQNYALQKYLEEHPNASAEEIQAFNQAGRANRSALGTYVNRYIQEHPEASSDDIKGAVQRYQTQTTAINRFMTGPQGNTIRSLNVVVGHLQTLQSLGDALKNGEIQKFNAISQTWAQQFGKPPPTNFDTAKQIVGAEIIKALGVAGAGTAEERESAANNFARANSPEQIAGAIGVARDLLLSQLRGLKQQFIASAGYGESPQYKQDLGPAFDEMLMPETRNYFGAISVGTGKLEPTKRDRDAVKEHPELRAKFMELFGVEP